MYARVFPSAGLWTALAAVAAANVVLMLLSGFRLAGFAASLILGVCAAAAGLGWFYGTVRPDERLSALAFGAAYLITYTLAAAVLSYIGTSAALPLLDPYFARADAALGLDWMWMLEASTAWPAFGRLLRLAYDSSMLQMVAVLLVLSATRQFGRLSGFLALFTVTSLTTIALSTLLPATGAYVHYDPPAAMRTVIGHDAGVWHLTHFEALRSGAMHVIDAADIQGLITFPSFHTALAAITVWALWQTRYVAYPALALNTLVIVATVPAGGHYFVDVIAGLAIAAAAIRAVTWQHSAAGSAPWTEERYHAGASATRTAAVRRESRARAA